jgi:F0F1-type ATP synthase beta subunit
MLQPRIVGNEHYKTALRVKDPLVKGKGGPDSRTEPYEARV